MSNNRSAAYLRSTIVAVVLAVLTIVEYFVATSLGASAVLLMLLALFKAIAVIVYYMHVSRLWTQEEGH